MYKGPIARFISILGSLCTVIGATLVFLALGHLMLGAATFLHDRLTGETQRTAWRFSSPVYDDFPEKAEYWREFENSWDTRFEPYIHWKRRPFAGKYINVSDEGVRLTTGGGPASDAGGRKKIFLYGGSTLWGSGAPDKDTIPSVLQAALGPDYAVYNFGETGFVSTQELNYLLYHLARGQVPDTVIFYDGVNDGYAGAYSPAIPRDPQNLRAKAEREEVPLAPVVALYDLSNYSRLFGYLGGAVKRLLRGDEGGAALSAWDARVAGRIAENAEGVVEVYEAHIKQVKALAREYGFRAMFFWQPNLFSLTREPRNDYERGIVAGASPTLVESQRQVYTVAKERFSGREREDIYFLGNVFDDVDEAIYIDWHHVGPNGNAIIAEHIEKALQRGG